MTDAQYNAWRNTRLPTISGGTIICILGPDEFYCRLRTGTWRDSHAEFEEYGPYYTYEEAQQAFIKYGRELLARDKAALDERERLLEKSRADAKNLGRVVLNMHKKGHGIADIAETTELSQQEVKDILDSQTK